MTKVIALGPGGKPQAPERSDTFRQVIDLVRQLGMLDQLLITPAARNHEHADEIRRALYRSARYYCSCGSPACTRKYDNIAGCPDGGQRISCRADVVSKPGPDGRNHYHVQLRLHDKREAIRSMIVKYGPDPSKWPYQAKAKKTREKASG